VCGSGKPSTPACGPPAHRHARFPRNRPVGARFSQWTRREVGEPMPATDGRKCADIRPVIRKAAMLRRRAAAFGPPASECGSSGKGGGQEARQAVPATWIGESAQRACAVNRAALRGPLRGGRQCDRDMRRQGASAARFAAG